MRTITDIAKEFDVSSRTIRYYEELGLLEPRRTDSNKRMYSNSDYAKLKLIFRGKRYGFSLDEIKEMVLLFDKDRTGIKQLERTVAFGEQKMAEIDEKIRELQEIRSEIETLHFDFTEKLINSKGGNRIE
ncbi:MerR family DNA-binding transcriptional regulator [Viridibacillus sp. YIM B01967]|uniref:MerR family DNA-binding transcriptional regulator n=1 Tax=Viridibacillus soli TaxID=2798301 RepID=A0ABS1HCC4_9BACL|nr:MerR family DNA-binding transcriptional regulator [Viridibacillus soli]MBK3497025.1 MerR family DNA-binding transcriptional regulator [Viridibacillus soli]